MGRQVEVRMPTFPECWDSCGACRSDGTVFVDSVLVRVGEAIRADDTLIVLETGKVALDIPSPYTGTVVAVRVEQGDPIDEGALIALVELV